MSENKWYNTAVKGLDIISSRLLELSNLMETVHFGLMKEGIEKQALDCIMCFLYTVNDIHTYTEQKFRELTMTESKANEA